MNAINISVSLCCIFSQDTYLCALEKVNCKWPSLNKTIKTRLTSIGPFCPNFSVLSIAAIVSQDSEKNGDI